MSSNLNAVRQDGNYFDIEQIKYNTDLVMNKKIIKKIYEIEFEDKFMGIMCKMKIKEQKKHSRTEFCTLEKCLKNEEYRTIFQKLMACIGLNGELNGSVFMKIIEKLAKPFLKYDSIPDFTMIEYSDGHIDLVSQPEIFIGCCYEQK